MLLSHCPTGTFLFSKDYLVLTALLDCKASCIIIPDVAHISLDHHGRKSTSDQRSQMGLQEVWQEFKADKGGPDATEQRKEGKEGKEGSRCEFTSYQPYLDGR